MLRFADSMRPVKAVLRRVPELGLLLLLHSAFPALAQTPEPGAIEPWRALARGSSLVARATVLRDASRFVADPQRKPTGWIQNPDGTRHLAPRTLHQYVAGTLIRLRLDEVLKTDGARVPGDVVDMFLSGYAYPRIHVGDELLVFLRYPIELQGLEAQRYGDWSKLYGMTVEDVLQGPAATAPFDPNAAYSLMFDEATLRPGFLKSGPETAPAIQAIAADLVAGDFLAYLSAPRNGSTVAGIVELVADARGRAMHGVQFQLDGADLGTEVVALPHRRSWDPATAAEGPHELRAVVRDSSGGLATSSPVLVEVQRGLRASGGSISENAASHALGFVVSLNAPAGQAVTVAYATSNGTATAGSDFVAASGTLTFAPGETTKSVNVEVMGDSVPEADEAFTLLLTEAVNAILVQSEAQGTILNDDLVSFGIGNVTVSERDSGTVGAEVTVTLSSPSASVASVNYATADGTATATGGDYVAASGTVTFIPGETSKTLAVAVNGDTAREPPESFFVRLSGASGGATVGAAQGEVTISDDDGLLRANTGCVMASGARALTVTVAGGPGNYGDWVGVFASGAANYSYSNWWYLNGAQTPPGSGLTNASFTATMPAAVGTYELRLFSQTTGYLASSNAVSVGTACASSVSIDDVVRSEGDGGTALARFSVSLWPAPAGAVNVTYATTDGTALAGSDYLAASGTLTFNPGETTKWLTVPLVGDGVSEPTETLFVNLGTATGGAEFSDAQGRATISDDDGPFRANPGCVMAGGARALTVVVTGGPGNPGDWVGVFAPGAANYSYSNWWYLNGAQTAPGSGLTNASFTATMPAAVGTNELRLFSQTTGYLRTSNIVSIAAACPP